jgi:hypothetical protein
MASTGEVEIRAKNHMYGNATYRESESLVSGPPIAFNSPDNHEDDVENNSSWVIVIKPSIQGHGGCDKNPKRPRMPWRPVKQTCVTAAYSFVVGNTQGVAHWTKF